MNHVSIPARLIWFAVTWVLWFLPFVLAGRLRTVAVTVDRRARWGILLQGVGYVLLWQGPIWRLTPSPARIVASAVFLTVAIVLAWTSPRALGRQFRVEAGLSADHELVQTGPYRFVRHPIYASMLCLLVGTGAMFSVWPFLAAAVVVFLVGTEIRVRIEDGLLEGRFGDTFRAYKRSVRAYAPFLR